LSEEYRLRLIQYRVLRKMFGTTKDEVTGVWRRIHNVELRELFLSPNIIRMINLGRLRWAGYIACMGGREVPTGFRWENLRIRDHLEDLGIDGRIILKLILKTWGGGKHGPVCECGNEHSGSTKCKEFLE
jgi:hypothetical protein